MFVLLFLICVVAYSEPSAFELQSGATKKELKTLKLSNKNLESVIVDLQNRVASLEQSQDGVKSLFEGQSLKIKGLLDTAAIHENSLKSLQALQDLHSNTLKQQADLLDGLKEQVESNKQAIEELDKKINDMSELLNGINTTMIAQLDWIKKNLATQTPDTDQSTPTSEDKTPQEPTFQKDVSKKKQIFAEALKLYSQRKLKEAKIRFQWTAEIPYRAAYSLYMLGEIAYKEKKYTDAIALYKKSALLDEKAQYMPILLWHTAWAFRYSKDMVNYNKFLESLLYLYPDSEQGQKAKEIINRTKGKK
ncbi:hypothetical protein BKH46_00580 [Helicobacter sp. 12S02634-8]|nr:hypothetical protein BKH46_00580 [Helicobacter sp. 12S02634-8]